MWFVVRVPFDCLQLTVVWMWLGKCKWSLPSTRSGSSHIGVVGFRRPATAVQKCTSSTPHISPFLHWMKAYRGHDTNFSKYHVMSNESLFVLIWTLRHLISTKGQLEIPPTITASHYLGCVSWFPEDTHSDSIQATFLPSNMYCFWAQFLSSEFVSD